MHFGTKSYLKSTRNHTDKHARTPFMKLVYLPTGFFTNKDLSLPP